MSPKWGLCGTTLLPTVTTATKRGGSIRDATVEGRDRVLGPCAPELEKSASAANSPRRAGSRSSRGKPQRSGLLASMGSVVSGHASDLWGVTLVTLGILTALAFYADALNPAGHYARLGLGDLLGWGRFLVPPILWPWACCSWSGGAMSRVSGPGASRREP